MDTRKDKIIPLDHLRPGESGRIVRVDLPAPMALKLAEMGLARHQVLTLVRRAPLGDPLEIEQIHYRLALRRSEAGGIMVRRLKERKAPTHGT